MISLADFYKRRSGIKLGLERMQAALACLDKAGLGPNGRVVLIGGTNGKGSTATLLYHLLGSGRVGLFTSPHLLHYHERIRCSHLDLNDADLMRELACLFELLPKSLEKELSFFELSTLLAVYIFRRENCEFQIFEVGLGGRLDSTNALDPELSAVCSIDYDHMAWLGSTLEEIAYEKLGICRRNKPLFWGEPRLQPWLAQQKAKFGFIPRYRGEDFELKAGWARTGSTKIEIPSWLKSRPFLAHNFSLAWALYRELGGICDTGDLHENSWSLRGRCEVLDLGTRRICVDVCHNPASAAGFAAGLPGETPVILGLLADKDVNGILDCFSGDKVLLFQPKTSRSFDSMQLAARHRHKLVFASWELAWEYVLESWPQESFLAVCGSFSAVSEVIDFFASSKTESCSTASGPARPSTSIF